MKDKDILSKEMETDLEGGPSMRQLDHYAKLLANRRIGRREFMGRALALGVTTALATSTASKALQAATPRKGGTVRCAYPEGGPDDQMDPPIWPTPLYSKL